MPKTVLIVDDELVLLDSVAQALSLKGYAVMKADNGADAVKIAGQSKPDIILLDIVLPDITGDEVARTLKKSPVTCAIPIIFLTGLLTRADVSTMIGGNAFIGKPYTIGEVVNAIEVQLAQRDGDKR